MSVWRCFGDILVIRAWETILPGTEITIPYKYTTTWILREKVLTPIIGGPGDCVMCVSECADGEDSYGLRQMLIEDMEIVRLAEHVHIKRLVSTY
jgi:hypothetical protein